MIPRRQKILIGSAKHTTRAVVSSVRFGRRPRAEWSADLASSRRPGREGTRTQAASSEEGRRGRPTKPRASRTAVVGRSRLGYTTHEEVLHARWTRTRGCSFYNRMWSRERFKLSTFQLTRRGAGWPGLGLLLARLIAARGSALSAPRPPTARRIPRDPSSSAVHATTVHLGPSRSISSGLACRPGAERRSEPPAPCSLPTAGVDFLFRELPLIGWERGARARRALECTRSTRTRSRR